MAVFTINNEGCTVPLTTTDKNLVYTPVPADCDGLPFPYTFAGLSKATVNLSYLPDSIPESDIDDIYITNITGDANLHFEYNSATVTVGDTIDFSAGYIYVIADNLVPVDNTIRIFFTIGVDGYTNRSDVVEYEYKFVGCAVATTTTTGVPAPTTTTTTGVGAPAPTTTTTTTSSGTQEFGLFGWSISASTGEYFSSTKKAKGQSVVGHYGTILEVRERVRKQGSPEFNLRAYIYEGIPQSGYSLELTELTLLGASTNLVAASSCPTSKDYVTFNFNNVVVGNEFTIMVRYQDVVTMNTSNTVGQYYEIGNVFADGQLYNFEYGWTAAPSVADNDFQILYSSAPTTTTTT